MKTYIQIGANIGNDYFQSKMQELTDSSRIILIEPNLNIIDQLKTNYTDLQKKHTVEFCTKAISIENKKTDLYFYTDHAHSSLINRATHNCVTSTLKVETITFQQLCEIYQINEIELLCVDTEGMDYEIINSIDFSQIPIHNLIFEEWPFSNDDINQNFKTGPIFFQEVKSNLEKFFTLKEIIPSNPINLFYQKK